MVISCHWVGDWRAPGSKTTSLAACGQERARRVRRLMQLYRARRLAVIGPKEALEALANGQVDELLVSGVLVETVTKIPDTGGETVSQELPQLTLSDQLMTKARHTGATITFIEDARLLESVGGVGGFLRWRG